MAACRDVVGKKHRRLPSCLNVLKRLINQGYLLRKGARQICNILGQVLIVILGGRAWIVGVSMNSGSVDFGFKI